METASELLLSGNLSQLGSRLLNSSLPEVLDYLATCHSTDKTSLMGMVIPTVDIVKQLPFDVLQSYKPYINAELIVSTYNTKLLSDYINNDPIIWENCLVACRALESAPVLKYLLDNYNFIPQNNSLLCSCTFSVASIKILAADIRACPSLIRPPEVKKSWFSWY